MFNHGLTAQQLDIIRNILKLYAHDIERVGLFGSRATGLYRANSDIDMVLYGNMDTQTIDRLSTVFDESALPVKVDLTAYSLITYPPLKTHIDAVMQVLFMAEQL
jgi:uncharacterized protein